MRKNPANRGQPWFNMPDFALVTENHLRMYAQICDKRSVQIIVRVGFGYEQAAAIGAIRNLAA